MYKLGTFFFYLYVGSIVADFIILQAEVITVLPPHQVHYHAPLV